MVERSDVGWTPVRKMIKAEAALERARACVRSCGRAGEKARRITREQGGAEWEIAIWDDRGLKVRIRA